MIKTYIDIEGYSVIPKENYKREFELRTKIQNEVKMIEEKMISIVHVGFITIVKPRREVLQIFESAKFTVIEDKNFVTISWDT